MKLKRERARGDGIGIGGVESLSIMGELWSALTCPTFALLTAAHETSLTLSSIQNTNNNQESLQYPVIGIDMYTMAY
jgi:hypothetical protein